MSFEKEEEKKKSETFLFFFGLSFKKNERHVTNII